MRALLALPLLFACSHRAITVPEGDWCDAPVDGGVLYLHAHNDYEHPRPLRDALDQHFNSVEADLWLRGEEIVVSHTAFTDVGLLRELYLDPLQARVDAMGSVYGDGQPFVIWFDIKDGGAPLRESLRALLARYPMFTTFDDQAVHSGPVTAILTGDGASKRAFVGAGGTQQACRDADDYSADDPPVDTRWRYYAITWGDLFSWNGEGSISDAELRRLKCLLGDIHRKGRAVRFYSVPDRASYWGLARSTGVDFINSDDLAGLHTFISTP